MVEVTLIIGLPGSGKTHLARSLQMDDPDVIILDDPKHLDEIETALSSGKNLIITDPHLCSEHVREIAVKFLTSRNVDVKFVYFENDQEKCRNNIEYRNDGRFICNLNTYNYTIPEGVVVREIWQNDKTP